MKTQHTPGPWSISKNRVSTHSKFYIRAHAVNKVIAEMPDQYWSRADNDVPAEQEYNARLIAAAPELLAALEDAVTHIAPQYGYDPSVASCLNACRTAIAKATDGAK